MNDKGVVPPRRPRRRFGFIAITVVTAIFAAIVASAVAAGALTDASRKAAAPDSSNARPGEPMATAAPAAHGVADNGTEFNGTFVLRNFREHRGVLEAVGRLTGTLGGQAVNQRVVLPVMGAATEAPAGVLGNGIRQQPVPTPGACDILTLALGPSISTCWAFGWR
jgi:hypothetical protein